MRQALGFDIEARRQMPTWTDALRLFIGQADGTGIMVMCSGVVLNNNNRRLDSDEFRGFALSDLTCLMLTCSFKQRTSTMDSTFCPAFWDWLIANSHEAGF
jgi:hypothetical protein